VTRWTPGHSAALTAAPLLGLNFHEVSPEHRSEVASALRRAAAYGRSADVAELSLPSPEPRILVAFYDGYRETALFGADLCSRLGIRAVFFPVFRVPDPPRGTITDADLADIAVEHELGFHTTTHLPAADITPANLQDEVLDPVERIRVASGKAPRVAAWRGGSRFDEALLGNRTLRGLGVRHLVSNWSVEPVPDAPSVAS